MGIFKLKSDNFSLSSISFPSGCPIITGGYNIYAVYVALISARSLYAEYARKHKRKSSPLSDFPIIWDKIISELEPFCTDITSDD